MSASSCCCALPPPPPPPPPCCTLICCSYSSSAFWRICSALCSGGSAPSGLTAASLRLRLAHRLHRLRQHLGDLGERRIALHELAVQPREQAFDLLAQPRLRQADDGRALAQLLPRHRAAIALHVEGRGDDLPLLLGERLDLAAAAAATATAAALRLRLTEVLVERADAQEVQVARRALAALHAVVVGRAREVRHRVARLHAQLFQVERVAGADLGQPVAPGEQLDRLLRPAVDRVDELEIADAEVVLGGRLDEHFLDRRRGRVAPRLGERDGRRLVGQHVDRVLRRRRHALAGRRLQLDAVEAVLVRLERRRRAIRRPPAPTARSTPCRSTRAARSASSSSGSRAAGLRCRAARRCRRHPRSSAARGRCTPGSGTRARGAARTARPRPSA